jgi:hypothetical protein
MSKLNIVRRKVLISTLIPILLLSGLLVFPVSAASSWSKPRPSTYTPYFETIENAYTDGKASIGVGVNIWDYVERPAGYPDVLTLRISASANSRVGIQYNIEPYGWYWGGVSNSVGITQDNSATKLNLPFTVRFYGVHYQSVWVSDNGFLSFEEPTTHTPQAIPNTAKPNSLIAPFWRDLDPSEGSITYGIAYLQGWNVFVISWNDVPNKGNGVKQSFQVIIYPIGYFDPGYIYHNTIRFSYKSVTKDYPTIIGVEDIVGDRGSSYNYNSLMNFTSLSVYYPVPGSRLERLTIKIEKSDTYATIAFIYEDEWKVGGYNVVLQNPSNPFGDYFWYAIGGAATVLITNHLAGIVMGGILIVAEEASKLAQELSPPAFDLQGAGVNDPLAYVTAQTRSEESSLPPFDATLSAAVLWSFTDPNDRDHSLTITAELEYLDFDYPWSPNPHISTSVSLSMYMAAPNTPSKPSGPTSGYTYTTYPYSTSTTDPNGDNVRYEFNWGDGTTTLTGWYDSGATASASHNWASSGTYYVRVRAQDSNNAWSDWSSSLCVSISTRLKIRTYVIGESEISDVKVWIDSDPVRYSPVAITIIEGLHTVKVETEFEIDDWLYTFSHWGDGVTSNPRNVDVVGDMTLTAHYSEEYLGRCPTLFVWNGTDYAYEALLNIHAESDVTLQHRIIQPLVKDGVFYKLSLKELDEFTSHIDQVRLYAVDSCGEWHICPLVSAIHSEQGWVTLQLRFDDDTRVDLTPTQTINLKFTYLKDDIAYFTFEINGYNRKWPG